MTMNSEARKRTEARHAAIEAEPLEIPTEDRMPHAAARHLEATELAVATERERCAAIADRGGHDGYNGNTIAAEIRRPTP